MTKRGTDSNAEPVKPKRRNTPSAAKLRREAWETQRDLQAGMPSPNDRTNYTFAPGSAPAKSPIPPDDEITSLQSEITRLEGMNAEPGTSLVAEIDKSDVSVDYLAQVRNKARSHSLAAVDVLVELMNDDTIAPMARWRAATSVIEIAEKDQHTGKKRLGELTIEELRALMNSLRNQEKLIGSGATVEGDANPLTDQPQQLDQQSGSLGQEPATIDQAPAPRADRPRRAIE